MSYVSKTTTTVNCSAPVHVERTCPGCSRPIPCRSVAQSVGQQVSSGYGGRDDGDKAAGRARAGLPQAIENMKTLMLAQPGEYGVLCPHCRTFTPAFLDRINSAGGPLAFVQDLFRRNYSALLFWSAMIAPASLALAYILAKLALGPLEDGAGYVFIFVALLTFGGPGMAWECIKETLASKEKDEKTLAALQSEDQAWLIIVKAVCGNGNCWTGEMKQMVSRLIPV
jgi:hypothetical protein